MADEEAEMPYDHFEHRHRFAAWAAARAAQRGWTSTSNLVDSLDQAGIPEFLRNPNADCASQQAFEDLHKKWCSFIVSFLKDKRVKGTSYGHAAKLVAVYLKAMVVNVPDGTSRLAHFAHPPIDKILLQNLSRCSELKSEHQPAWRKVAWTRLGSDAYYELITQLRGALSENDPWWKLEKHWTVTNEPA